MRDLLVLTTFALAAALVPYQADAAEVRFTPEDGHAYNPVFSIDGKWIAFEVNRYDGGSVDLYMSNVTGAIAKDGVKVKLPGGASAFGGQGQVLMNPTWHKDGISVFEGSNQGGQYRLYIYTPGGASATELLKATDAPGHLTFPTVSTDGRQVAFVTGATGEGDIRTWNNSNAKIENLTQTPHTESFPRYSADGKHMLFTRKSGGTEDVFELDLASKAEKLIVGGAGDQTRPIYAAGGNIVYFTSERGQSTWDIAVVDGAGQNKRIVAKDVGLPLRSRPALSPDGQWVAWTAADPTQDTRVFVGKVDGSQVVEVQTDFRDCEEPAIGVQGNRVLLAFTYLVPNGADWRKLYVIDITDKIQ
jgi:Tol biopolymer transport system component